MGVERANRELVIETFDKEYLSDMIVDDLLQSYLLTDSRKFLKKSISF